MTTDKPSLRYRLLRSCALQSRKVQWALRRIEDRVGTSTGAILNRMLKGAQKEALSIDLYGASFQPENEHGGLYPWETQWFERRLPSPPAAILIGAAGSGREASALRGLGYQVHAFEPSAPAHRVCERTIGSELVDNASYQDLVAATLRGETTPLRLAGDAKFDAVLLGWGSFGHVLQRADRFELLRACDKLAPDGPILLSVFDPKDAAETDGVFYTPWGGFLVRPSVEELDAHAKALNRQLIVSLQSPSSYATLVPTR